MQNQYIYYIYIKLMVYNLNFHNFSKHKMCSVFNHIHLKFIQVLKLALENTLLYIFTETGLFFLQIFRFLSSDAQGASAQVREAQVRLFFLKA